MPVDFSRIARSKHDSRPIDPIELFHSLAVSDGNINDLWLAQGDALRTWHEQRQEADTGVVLNTGAGKTLVGLLAAQSLVNETNGHVVYACSSIQLVQQTAAKAHGYGLQATTYFNREFSNDLYQQAIAPCITTYQALFNGLSRFFRDDISAIVFDDAHAAEHLLRDAFTLRITRTEFSSLYNQVFRLFRTYHSRAGLSVGYEETFRIDDPNLYWFVPPFTVKENLAEFQRILLEADFTSHTSTMFAWEHLKNHLDLCTCFVTGQDIIITPPVVPVDSLPYFQPRIRRLYLSATFSAKDAFLRTFGRIPNVTIAPATNAGECERLILIPALNEGCDDDRNVAKTIAKTRKSLILVPTHRQSQKWSDISSPNPDTDVTNQVERFKQATAPQSLILVSRYDGVDLPGDTCRVMVIDDLPSGLGMLEKYLWERLGLVKSLRSTIASRIVQSFGRISRGMSDHGVVVLTGSRLIEWLLAPVNRNALPIFLRHQLELGMDISKQANGVSEIIESVEQCLQRDGNWVSYYQENMREYSRSEVREQNDDEDALLLATLEINFIKAYWSRDFNQAARIIQTSLEKVFSTSRNVGAWYSLWLGYCYDLLGEIDSARTFYRRAHASAKNIPPYVEEALQPDGESNIQVNNVYDYLHAGSRIRNEIIEDITIQMAALDGSGSSKQIEEALRVLGEALGLDSSRPDKEYGTGPDVLWLLPNAPSLSMEVKSGKIEGKVYRKRDLGQLRDHTQWVFDHTQSQTVYQAFVGPIMPASADSNPDSEIVVIDLGEFQALSERIRATIMDICSSATVATLKQRINELFKERLLYWPEVYGTLDSNVLREISAVE